MPSAPGILLGLVVGLAAHASAFSSSHCAVACFGAPAPLLRPVGAFWRAVPSRGMAEMRMMAEESAEEKKRRVLAQVMKESAAIINADPAARKAAEAAEEAAARLAMLKERRGSGAMSRGSSPPPRPVTTVLHPVIPPPPPVASKRADEPAAAAREGPTRIYSHRFFDVSLEKPMGMILEDNDPTLGGVYVKDVNPSSPAGQVKELQEGAQIVLINGKSVKGATFDEVMEMLRSSASPVKIQFYDGSASSLYGGWGERPRGREVTVIPDRPSKALIERIRSGL